MAAKILIPKTIMSTISVIKKKSDYDLPNYYGKIFFRTLCEVFSVNTCR